MPKGRGITAARAFQAKDFVAVYGGELLSKDAAKQREAENLDEVSGSYMIYFEWKNADKW